MPRVFDPRVPSDGMTVDSPRGPVDLVALDRVQSWWRTDLTWAEKAALDQVLTGSWEQAERVAYGMGCHRDSVLRRETRARVARRELSE